MKAMKYNCYSFGMDSLILFLFKPLDVNALTFKNDGCVSMTWFRLEEALVALTFGPLVAKLCQD